jgi:DNA primase
MKTRVDVTDYYRRLRAISIADVAERLMPQRITERKPQELRCDCPHHESQSKTSLSVSVNEGLWHCFACGVGGDALQLVEWVFHGAVSKGKGGVTSTHRAARDWLAQMIGLPLLSEYGMSQDDLERFEENRARDDAVFVAMTELARYYHAKLMADTPDAAQIREWLFRTYTITEDSLRRLLIGWADDDEAFDRVMPHCESERALIETGAFRVDSNDNCIPFFQRRVVFPYWSAGRVVYMIARILPWDPSAADTFEPKYKKLPTQSDGARQYISKAVNGSVLWGEDVLAQRPKRVLVTEGVTDAIAAQQAGFAVVAITGALPSQTDIENVVRKLRGCGTVYFAQDNEISGIGQFAAMKTARMLERESVECKIAVIPTRPDHEAARASLLELLGQDVMNAIADAPPANRKSIIRAAVTGDRVDEVERLLNAAKVDVADFFARGGTAAELEAAMVAARDPMEMAIDSVRVVEDKIDQARRLSAGGLMVELSRMKPAKRDAYVKRLKERTGVTRSILDEEIADAKKAAKETGADKEAARAATPTVAKADPESCAFVVETERIAAGQLGRPIAWETIAEGVYLWIVAHGGRFFRDRAGIPALFFDNQVWPMVGGGSGERTRYEGLLYRLTGLVPTTSGPRTFYSILAAIAADRGSVKDQFPWIHTDVSTHTVWVNLNNERREIVKITPHGVTVLKNGDNDDGIILRGDSKFGAIEFDGTVPAEILEPELDEMVASHLACKPESKRALLAWMLCLPLLEFAGTRPMIRLEGPAASGKTFAAKMITTLVYGDEAQKKSTDAANYADAARNPLVALDNVEVQNATPALIDFLLTSVTGITREKRAAGTDAGIISERPTCLVLSTGIEPLAGELEEVMTRSLVLRFDRTYKDRVLLEKQVLARIKRERSRIFSAMFQRTAEVLAMVEAGHQEGAMQLIRSHEGHSSRTRSDEYLALMYMQGVAAAREDRAHMLTTLTASFGAIVSDIDATAASTTRESSSIATPMIALFSALAESKQTGGGLRFGLHVNEDNTVVRNASSTTLFLALRGLAKDRGFPFAYKNASQFGARLSGSVSVLGEHGFGLEVRQNPYGHTIYDIVWHPNLGMMTPLNAEELIAERARYEF